jgi:hypothetical protein
MTIPSCGENTILGVYPEMTIPSNGENTILGVYPARLNITDKYW